MSTEQLITILAGAGAIILFALSHRKVVKTWKIFLYVLFLTCIVTSTTLNWFYLEKKESKEAEHETKMDQIDTHVKASLGFKGYIEAAQINRRAGRTDEAIYDVECALKKEPKSARALNLLGVLYFEKGDYDSAIEMYARIEKGLADSSITISHVEYIYHRNFARAYMARNMWVEAKKELGLCLSLNDNYLTCYLDLAKTLDRLKEWQELCNLCIKTVTKFPTSTRLHIVLEVALLNAVLADPTFGRPYLYLGVICFLKKEHEKSASFVEKALELDPTLAKDIEILKDKKLLQ